jgi:hypothetical protein
MDAVAILSGTTAFFAVLSAFFFLRIRDTENKLRIISAALYQLNQSLRGVHAAFEEAAKLEAGSETTQQPTETRH